MAGENGQLGAPIILARELNALVVVPNYRLGTLGYLVMSEAGITGNYGIGDVLTALKFVRPLLASFHGNASQVTLMGQSSGGTNIFALLASPASRGLFAAAISMSGSPNITASVSQTSALQRKYLLPLIGCESSLPCLLTRDPMNLTNAMGLLQGEPPGSFNPPNLPVGPGGNELIGAVIVDGVIVKLPLLDALAVPIVDVDLWVQSAQCELDPCNATADSLATCASWQAWMEQYFSTWPNGAGIAKSLVQAYCPGAKSVEQAFESFVADCGVTCGNDRVASAARAAFKSRVVRSHLVGAPSHPFMGKRFAFHSWDYPVAGVGLWGPLFKPQPQDFALGESIRGTWKDFVYGVGSYSACVTIAQGGRIVANCSGPLRRCAVLDRLGLGGAEFWWVN